MIDKNLVIERYENPVLLDSVIQSINDNLKADLPWLDYAFPRAYKLVEHTENSNKFVYPAIYIGGSEYVSVLPNDNFGNFSWFDIYDPQTINAVVQGHPEYLYTGAIVFWFNLKSIIDDDSRIYLEDIKLQILKILSSPKLLRDGKFTAIQIFERFENIYRGYSLEKVYNDYMYANTDIPQIDKMYFMYPYSGLRIEFKIKAQELC